MSRRSESSFGPLQPIVLFEHSGWDLEQQQVDHFLREICRLTSGPGLSEQERANLSSRASLATWLIETYLAGEDGLCLVSPKHLTSEAIARERGRIRVLLAAANATQVEGTELGAQFDAYLELRTALRAYFTRANLTRKVVFWRSA